MATISISKQLSGVTIHSTATITEKSRSSSSVILNLSFSTHLNSSGFIGTGYSVVATVTAYGITKNVTLKSSSSSWSGSAEHTTNTTMTISVPATVNSISVGYKIKFDGETATGTNKTLTLSKVLASVTSATAFSDTTNTTMTFSNPAGFKIRPYLNFYDKSGGTLLLTLFPSGSSTTGNTLSSPYTWNITDAQRKTIRDTLKNKTSCYVAVGLNTYDSSGTRVNYSSKGVTFTNVLKPPIFTNFEFEDVNDETLNLTGDNQKIIKGYSTLEITINTENKAVAQNEATMSHYLINGIQYPYAENFVQEIPKWSNNTIEVYAVDSRGITTKVTKTSLGEEKDFTMIEYTPIVKDTISAKRENNVEELTKLIYDGSFWNNNFGAIENNLSASYKYRVSDTSDYIDGITTINPIKENNNFSFKDYIKGDSVASGFLVENSYEIVVTVKDVLSEITYSAILGSGIPAIAVYKNYVALHGKYDEELGGTQIYGGAYLDGTPIEIKTEQKILWQGGMYMREDHTANLSEKISEQKNGIVVVFSGYANGSAQDYNWASFFIPKKWATLHSGAGNFFLIGGTSGLSAFKYIYVHDNKLVGHANNSGTQTQNGIAFNNSGAVLRYVIGV